MNKSALKKFATEARKELLERVELQARKIGITAESIQKANVESSDAVFIDGRQLSDVERRQRNKLIARINEIGFDRVMEETAYTWFNRFIALRYMEVNDYLPTKVRVLSSTNDDSAEPDMMKEALSLDLELDKEYVYELKMNNKTDELFKYLIKIHCNDLNRYMPFMFETLEDYKVILFPEGLLGTDSFVRQMTNTDVIAESDWQNVEIVGWLYQYYISEENERVIKAKKRYKAEELPFATQLFTPEWIVRYMVQNALGRYWVESHPEHRDLIQNWEFYLENPNPEPDFKEKLAPYINKELNVEDIKCFDPAMGSGHILVYMFDVLFEIYSKCGYMEREIPRLIIEKNLYGLDIDDRAYQLASFSIVMKALQYNRRFLRSIERDGLKMNLASFQETNNLTDEEVVFLAGTSTGEVYENVKAFVNQFKHAKAIGSLIQLEEVDLNFLQNRLNIIEQQSNDLFELELKNRTLELFNNLLLQTSIMVNKYDVFITNPPYVGGKYVTPEVSTYLNEKYPDVKSDLFSAFIEYSFTVTKENGQMGFMTPFVWMFITSYEKLRHKIINEKTISSLIQLEYSGFDGATVPICTFTLRNYRGGLKGEYIRLADFKGVKNQPIKTREAVQNPSVPFRYTVDESEFKKIPGCPIAYWASDNLLHSFEIGQKMGDLVDAKQGLATADNDRFLRLWWEPNFSKIKFDTKSTEESKTSGFKWVPYNKGGERRQWYGNYDYIVNWENDGEEIRNFKDSKGKQRSVVRSPQYYFRDGITWSDITSGDFAIRYRKSGSIHDVKGMTAFHNDSNVLKLIMGIASTKVANYITKLLNPTISMQIGDFQRIPIVEIENKDYMISIVDEQIQLAKQDWDMFEISWEFQRHPLIVGTKLISESYHQYKVKVNNVFDKIKSNEEILNRIVIDAYGIDNDLNPEVSEKNITVSKVFDSKDEITEEIKGNNYVLTKEVIIKQFLNYFVGISFGRYSLDEEGLVYAGGEFEASRYQTFPVDEDNILPILPGAYFEDDVVTRFVDFVRVTFSEESLDENLDFIADAIGRKANETSRETLRRYFLNDFYKDHVQVYKKRPIYWLFTSGKEKAFNCLIYMHRYDKTTLSRIRTDYLHEVQIRMDAEKKDLLTIIEGDYTAKEISNAKKELKALDKKIDELKAYDELLHHMADMQIEIDLDDGVKVNYEKFKGLLAKI